jgi:chemotaxis protein methyltransferase CheR
MLPDLARRRIETHIVGPGWRFREPSDAEFQAFARLVHELSGISLNDSKRALVARRLNARLRELGIETLGEYADVVRGDTTGAETVTMLDLIATNETHFFRERPHFEFLETRVFPTWLAEAEAGQRSKLIRAWSAACSTGQEPYSLAMQLLTYFPPSHGWQLDVQATDISTQVLDVARRADWPVSKAPEIPERYLREYMLRGTGTQIGRMRATRELRDAVRFSRINLNEAHYHVPGVFDLIFCRNVLIYFSTEGRAAVIERLTDRLSAGGLLFVGHAESLHAHRNRLRAVLPTVYARAA